MKTCKFLNIKFRFSTNQEKIVSISKQKVGKKQNDMQQNMNKSMRQLAYRIRCYYGACLFLHVNFCLDKQKKQRNVYKNINYVSILTKMLKKEFTFKKVCDKLNK